MPIKQTQVSVEPKELRGASSVQRVESVFIDTQYGIRFAKRFDFVRVKGGGKAVKGIVVGVEEGVRGLEAGTIPIMVGGEGLGLSVLFHVDNVGLLGCGGERKGQEEE